jgi:myo-inositol-1(or 4)-monophosphatase
MSSLSPAVEAVAAEALRVVGDTLDGLAADLRAAAGRSRITTKADGTPVTEADLDADRRLTERIAEVFPGHGILSEEASTVAPDTEWTWIIDPIDGTSNFTTGVPYWAVSIALAHEGRPVAAVVDAPPIHRRYHAIAGRGALRDGRPIRVRPTVDWRDARNGHVAVMLTTGPARRARGAGVRLNVRVMGSIALDLAIVADGGAVASLAVVPHVWDVAAGGLLVTESGGAVAVIGEPLLPLEPGVDHRTRASATAAAADEVYARGLASALLPG